MLDELYTVLLDRKQQAPAGSYTHSLLTAGEQQILRKIHEETFELIQAAHQEGEERLIEESADLLYHWLVLLVSRGISLELIWQELRKRRGAAAAEEKASG
ncbi:MAG: phosphoribosyl-ATP diphosphatase [Anaerolineales bacterium]